MLGRVLGAAALSLVFTACAGKNDVVKGGSGSGGTAGTGAAGAGAAAGTSGDGGKGGSSGAAGGASGASGSSDGGKGGGGTGGSGGTGGAGGVSGGGGDGATSAGGAVEAGAGGGPAGPGTVNEFYEALYRAQCDFEERCASQNGRTYTTLQACLATVDERVETLDAVLGPSGLLDLLRVDSGADMQACLSSLYPPGDCTFPPLLGLPPECREVLSIVNPLAVGDPCGADVARACDLDATCVERDSCRRCEAAPIPGDDGAPCTSGGDCLSVHCVNGFCATVGERGSSCMSSGECQGNLICRGDPLICDDLGSEGDACAADYSCLKDLACRGDPPVCVPRSAVGTPCDRTSTVPCSGLCVFEQEDAAMGVCGFELPVAGEPCAYQGAGPICYYGHAYESFVDGAAVACVCRDHEAAGGPCRSDLDCVSRSCTGADPQDPAVFGSCDALVPIGGECSRDENCETGFCGELEFCDAPPVCG